MKQGRPDFPFFLPGEVLGKPVETAEILSLFCGGSKDDLVLLDACGFSSPGFTPFSVGILPVEPQVLVAEEVALSQAPIFSVGGLIVEDCPDPTALLAELKDVLGQGTELLFDSPLSPAENAFERDTAELVFNVVSPLLSLSSIFVLVGIF